MAENYNLIFGQSASQQYGWSDSDYQNGWQTVGSTPPTAEQFDALQRRSDTKAKDLNDRLSPLETAASKALADLTPAVDKVPYFNSQNTAALTDITDAGRAVLAKSSADELLQYVVPNNAGAHNAIYRGKYLGTAVTDAQYAVISAGTFEDLFIGDYWTINSVNWRIAAFDYWLHCGDTECTTHHVVIVPDTSLANAQMNSANVTDGGYVGSNFYTGVNNNTGKATAVSAINSAFGSSHILNHRECLTNAVTDGKPTGIDWYDSTVELMDEAMVYGAHFFEPNPNGQEPWTYCTNHTIDKTQLPLFAHDPSRITNRDGWWLRGVVSAAYFASVANSGLCNSVGAINSIGVRPAFGIA